MRYSNLCRAMNLVLEAIDGPLWAPTKDLGVLSRMAVEERKEKNKVGMSGGDGEKIKCPDYRPSVLPSPHSSFHHTPTHPFP